MERRRAEEDNVTHMEEEEREVYLNQLTAEERSKIIKLTEKHATRMLDLIYRKKMEYFKAGNEEEWKVSEQISGCLVSTYLDNLCLAGNSGQELPPGSPGSRAPALQQGDGLREQLPRF